ncbi:hypothetical protein U0070_014092, partial [Myodes glareolus]
EKVSSPGAAGWVGVARSSGNRPKAPPLPASRPTARPPGERRLFFQKLRGLESTMEEKRRKYSISSENSDTTDSKALPPKALEGQPIRNTGIPKDLVTSPCPYQRASPSPLGTLPSRSRDIHISIKMFQTAQQYQVGLAPAERKEAL